MALEGFDEQQNIQACFFFFRSSNFALGVLQNDTVIRFHFLLLTCFNHPLGPFALQHPFFVLIHTRGLPLFLPSSNRKLQLTRLRRHIISKGRRSCCRCSCCSPEAPKANPQPLVKLSIPHRTYACVRRRRRRRRRKQPCCALPSPAHHASQQNNGYVPHAAPLHSNQAASSPPPPPTP